MRMEQDTCRAWLDLAVHFFEKTRARARGSTLGARIIPRPREEFRGHSAAKTVYVRPKRAFFVAWALRHGPLRRES